MSAGMSSIDMVLPPSFDLFAEFGDALFLIRFFSELCE
jgi:hypothetical protein